MDKDEFISAILLVHQSVTNGIKKILNKPPGRKPSNDLVQLSSWFNALSESDQDMVLKISSLASRHATLAFLCILDGVKTIEDGPNKGELKLYYKNGLKKNLLNDRKGEFLAQMFYTKLVHDQRLDENEIT